MKPIHTIDDVINVLQNIIDESIKNKSPLGYFAALYKKVTLKVKEGIEDNFFDDGPRMEKLDVIFAKRYIDAYYKHQQNESISLSWQKAFHLANQYWPTVLQHLLIGMNAHINLDLGIAAAEVSKGKPINNLKGDFNKINDVLSSLVNDVEKDLTSIWPFLKKILKFTKNTDDFLIDFSMKTARDGAWAFAVKLSNTSADEISNVIQQKDINVSNIGSLVTSPGFIVNLLFGVIRLGEKGSIDQKISDLTN